MNFYKHYIGDFQRDTGHLSLTERGAYLALIHHYYATEIPLPASLDALYRIAGAVSPLERKAVVSVLGFFEQVDSGYMHSRIEAEISKAGEVSNTNREIALAREAKRRAEKEAKTEHEHSTKRAKSVSRSKHEQSTNQTPDTRLKPLVIDTQKVITNTSDSVCSTPAGEICKAIKLAGITDINHANPTFQALVEAGASIDEFVQAAGTAVKNQKPHFSYILGIVKKQRQDAAQLVLHKGALPANSSAREAGRQIAASSIFKPEHTQHLQSVQEKTIEASYVQIK